MYIVIITHNNISVAIVVCSIFASQNNRSTNIWIVIGVIMTESPPSSHLR